MDDLLHKPVEIYSSAIVKSTNDSIKNFISSDKITIFIAKKQTLGRGKGENKWISPEGNLYMSIGFISDYKNLNRLVFIIALAISNTLEKVEICYKWPNDIFMNGKKLGGILIERFENQIIIGIGLNIHSKPVETAACLSSVNRHYEIDGLVQKIIYNFKKHINYIENFNYIKTLWEKRALFLNNYINFNDNDQTFYGKFIGINSNGSLKMLFDNGSMKSFHSGSICIT